jgi:hypothetical protein
MKPLIATDPETYFRDLITENLAALRARFPGLVAETRRPREDGNP